MPFALLIVGVLLLVASVRGTQSDLFKLVKGDFTGENNFIYWMVSILIIGSLGYIPSLQKLSRVFMALVVVVLFLSRKGFFSQFQSQISQSVSGGTGSTTPTVTSSNQPSASNLPSGLAPWLQQGFPITGLEGIEVPLAPARPQ